MQPAGGIQDHRVVAFTARRLHGALGDGARLFAHYRHHYRYFDALAQLLQLLLRRRSIDVERRH